MKKIVHGGDVYSYKDKFDNIIDFSANINPLGIPANVKLALHNAVEKCIDYPDPLCRKLTEAVAIKEQIKNEYLVFGNGAADVIFRFVNAVKPKKALIIAPTFGEYALALKSVSCEITYYYLNENNDFEIQDDILNLINHDIDIVFLCNPNNPTGIVTDKNLMIKILNRCNLNNVILALDECFNDFLEDGEKYTLKDKISEYENLFIFKAFTKIYAIPGVRLGYGICANKRLIDDVNNMGQAWSVSLLAQEAGIAAVKEEEFVKKTQIYVKKQREYLKNELLSMDFVVYNSKANYIFFKNNTQIDIQYQLEKQGILIRNCSNYIGLNGSYYRIAVKSEVDNQLIVKALNTMFI